MARSTLVGRFAGGAREVVLLVVDVSASMDERFNGSETKLHAAIRACENMIASKRAIDPLDEIGAISFDEEAKVELPPVACGSHAAELVRAVRSLSIRGGTDIDAGLVCADGAFDWGRHGITRRACILTDGQGGDPLKTAMSLKARGVVLDVIGVGGSPDEVDEKLLKAMASTVAGELRYRFIKDQRSLVTHYTALANKTQLGA